MYELYYSTDGHGGPYHSITKAVEAAEMLLKGNISERWIKVVDRHDDRVTVLLIKDRLTGKVTITAYE